MGSPFIETPERSPLISAAKTGTPGDENASAKNLHGHGLAGAGGAGDETMAIGHGQIETFALAALAYKHRIIHDR